MIHCISDGFKVPVNFLYLYLALNVPFYSTLLRAHFSEEVEVFLFLKIY